ncbi:MAG: hypothetical protein ACNI3C_06485 [Candidatus Marinarcus sp.]|uniref:hypothetical protein n=1 Tax=Candidatus Marinarcus sp. TaxID=3100987 RepID=UPI003AFFA517
MNKEQSDIQKSTYRYSDPEYDVIYEIIKIIKHNSDFDAAAQIAISNHLTLNHIIAKTMKLNIFDIAKLADSMNKLKS